MKRLGLAVALAAAAALAAPAGAGAIIQVDRGIAGVRVGNTPAQVKAALGRPDSARKGRDAFGPFTRYRYTAESITVEFQGSKGVVRVSTTGVGDRTRRGVGVGSPEKTVKERVRGITCEVIAGDRSCHTGYAGRRRVTDFAMKNGRVVRVNVVLVAERRSLVTPPSPP